MKERNLHTEQRMVVDERYAFRGIWDTTPEGQCRIRIIDRGGIEPILLISELPDNPSTSITNIMEHLAPELLQHYLPHRFEELTPAMMIEHYPASPEREQPTYDLVTFSSWRLKRVWLGGQERLSLGEPTWRPLPEEEVQALLGDLVDDL